MYNFHLSLTLYSSGGEKNIGFLLFKMVLQDFVFFTLMDGNSVVFGFALSSEDFCVFNFLTVFHATENNKNLLFSYKLYTSS